MHTDSKRWREEEEEEEEEGLETAPWMYEFQGRYISHLTA